MERLLTLKKREYLKDLKSYGITGVIVGSRIFSTRYNFDLREQEEIAKECREYGLDLYISIDTMIEERKLVYLDDYLEHIRCIEAKGIYYADLAVLKMAKDKKMDVELIYDPGSIMTNSLDANFYLTEGNDRVVAARELTLAEVIAMAEHTNHRVDMQIFGYLKASTSKRKFLTNYFKHVGKDFNPYKKENLRIVEETRDYDMPIYENSYGTQIYTDYCLITYQEKTLLDEKINRGIIDDNFLSEEELFTVLADYQNLNADNAVELENALKERFNKRVFDSGYLYQKTNIMK